MPGSSPTMDRRSPRIALNSVDFPTFGLPTITTVGNVSASAIRIPASHSAARLAESNGLSHWPRWLRPHLRVPVIEVSRRLRLHQRHVSHPLLISTARTRFQQPAGGVQNTHFSHQAIDDIALRLKNSEQRQQVRVCKTIHVLFFDDDLLCGSCRGSLSEPGALCKR